LNLFLFAGGQGSQGGGLMAYLPFILILAIMYFLMIRPQAKRQKEKQKMLGSLKKGDRVITIGGIHGSVNGLKGKDKKIVNLKVANNINLSVNRSAISGLIDKIDETEVESIEEQS
jgi:preprotein translocase subunit YajC|tara:strand:- start:8971 stop:9318 length:348 start_codon:yes stop_codon:yes gene_type:complete